MKLLQKKRFLKTILDDLSDAGNEYAQNPSVGKSKILGIEKTEPKKEIVKQIGKTKRAETKKKKINI